MGVKRVPVDAHHIIWRSWHIAAATSMLLFLATIVLWVRSYANWDVFAHRRRVIFVLLESDGAETYPGAARFELSATNVLRVSRSASMRDRVAID